MRFYLKLAWRNIFRNRRRTFLTGLIIGVGLAAMMFTDAWIVGMKENLISSATSSFLGHAQIHREGFQESFDSELTVGREERILSALEQDAEIETFTRRTVSYGTISSPAGIASVVLYGIDHESEPPISRIDESLISGAYLEGDRDKGALIGFDLAEELEAEVGSRIVVTVAEAETGDLYQQLLRVSGIYRTHIERFDESVVLIPLGLAQEMLGIGEEVHEIAVRFNNPRRAQTAGKEFAQAYSRFGNDAQAWPELLPQIKYILDMTDISVGITVIIVFAIIIFGIINTLFMSLYERTFEFGVLRAVGTRAGVLWKLIVFEAGSLAVYAMAVGMVLGAGVIALGAVFGMDLTGVELAGTTFTGRIYTVFTIRQFTVHPLLVFVFTILVSFYPAHHASRMSIAGALQRAL